MALTANERARQYRATAKYRAYRTAYNRRPEVKAKQLERVMAKYVPAPNGIRWKGDEVGYYGMHYRLRRDVDLSACCVCGEQGRVEAALLTGRGNHEENGLSYSVDAEDYVPMCVRCHRLYDQEARDGVAA